MIIPVIRHSEPDGLTKGMIVIVTVQYYASIMNEVTLHRFINYNVNTVVVVDKFSCLSGFDNRQRSRIRFLQSSAFQIYEL